MPKIFTLEKLDFIKKETSIEEYKWETTNKLGDEVNSQNLVFDIRKLFPNTYSFPFHFHHNSEELFYIIEGEATLRTQESKRIVKKGDIVFMEIGATGAHQLYNHSDAICVYLDLRTKNKIDIVEYPDSNKINFMPQFELFDKQNGKVNYYDGEENPKLFWDKN
jgi:uncharacterized cupin superfamily protein